VHGWFLYLFCVLGVCIQTMVANKFLGMLVLIVLFFTAMVGGHRSITNRHLD